MYTAYINGKKCQRIDNALQAEELREKYGYNARFIDDYGNEWTPQQIKDKENTQVFLGIAMLIGVVALAILGLLARSH